MMRRYAKAISNFVPDKKDVRKFFNYICRKYKPNAGEYEIDVMVTKKVNFRDYEFPFTTACIIDNVLNDRDEFGRINMPRIPSCESADERAHRIAMNNLCDEFDKWYFANA